jgi:hypothetical protein
MNSASSHTLAEGELAMMWWARAIKSTLYFRAMIFL